MPDNKGQNQVSSFSIRPWNHPTKAQKEQPLLHNTLNDSFPPHNTHFCSHELKEPRLLNFTNISENEALKSESRYLNYLKKVLTSNINRSKEKYINEITKIKKEHFYFFRFQEKRVRLILPLCKELQLSNGIFGIDNKNSV